MSRPRLTLCCALTSGLVLVGCARPLRQSGFVSRRLSKTPTVALGRIDAEADLRRIKTVVVLPADTSKIKGAALAGLSPAGLSSVYQDLLAERLAKTFPHIKKVLAADPRLTRPSKQGDVAVLETQLVVVDPGSAFMRLCVSFGAGSTNVQIDGRLRMLEGTRPLVEWSDRTGSWWGGASTVSLIYRNLGTLAKRSAAFIKLAAAHRSTRNGT